MQVATWLQLRRDVPSHVVVGFEDGLTVVSVRVDRRSRLVRRGGGAGRSLQTLLQQSTEHGRHVDLDSPDRSNDPLRKAEYVVPYRPRWFSLVAGDGSSDHEAELVGEHGFALRPVHRDVVLRSLAG